MSIHSRQKERYNTRNWDVIKNQYPGLDVDDPVLSDPRKSIGRGGIHGSQSEKY